ncbi:MAG: ATP-binding cassette domain-containing protein, partial [Bacteroidota bacterium]
TLQVPDEGQLFFNEIDVLKNPMELRKQLGYLPQEFGVYPKDSAHKLLHYLATLKGIVSKKDRNAIVEEVLDLTNLWEVRGKSVSSYSGGMKQRFGIAQILLNDPKLVIVDEPTAGLDPAERSRFLNVLRNIGSSRIVIFSTHLVEDVKDLCHELAILNKGQVLAQLSPKKALSALKEKIWETEMDLSSQKNQFKVLSSHYNEENKKVYRVFAETMPSPVFRSVQPKLEDYYFYTINS